MYTFKLQEDYHATGNNCTTISLEGIMESLPDIYKKLSDSKESKGRGLGWKEKLADKTIGNNSLGNKIFMPGDLKVNVEKANQHKESKVYSSKKSE